MTLDQLKKSMQVIIKSLLDPTIALNLKNTLIYILYSLGEKITVSKNYNKIELQHEVLESLVIFSMDLEH